jgi:molybdopterin-guanine dinucleotide biosynthesis protein A
MVKASGLILSGGRATRMGGVDKGLVNLHGKPLIAHVISRIAPQVDELFINANRELDQYNTLGYPVLADETQNFSGPLAGFQLALKNAKHDYVCIVPCDSPFLPENLVQKLFAALLKNDAEIAVASSDQNSHPVCCLCKKNTLPSLEAFVKSGQGKVSAWQKSLRYVEVDFTEPSDNGATKGFLNLNTLEDLYQFSNQHY